MLGERDYLMDKLHALEAAEQSAIDYIAQIDAAMGNVKAMADEARDVADKDKIRRIKHVTQKGIRGLPFYQFDSHVGVSSYGIELMKEIVGSREKQIRARRLSQAADLVSYVSTSSSDVSFDEYEGRNYKKEEDMPPPEEEDFEDFDSRSEDGVLGKRLQQGRRLKSTDQVAKVSGNDQTSLSDSSIEWKAKKKIVKDNGNTHEAAIVDQDQAHAEKLQNHTQRLNSIIKEYGMTPENIQNFNLVEIAAKKNSAKHLQQSGMPIFGCQIYKQLRILNKMRPAEPESGQHIIWTPQQDTKLVQLVELFSERRWKQVSTYMDTKKPAQCYHRWFRVLSPKRDTSKWDDPMEDVLLALGSLMFKRPSGKVRWVKVAELFEGRRTDVQCRERFVNILDPNLKPSMTNDKQIMAKGLFDKFGRQWAKIAKEVKGSTDNLVKRMVEKNVNIVIESESMKSCSNLDSLDD
jgi:Myb-like DNA-binding domain